MKGYESQKLYWEERRERRTPEHPIIQAFVEPKVNCIRRIISDIEEKKKLSLLDIGCGNGFFTYYFERIYDTISLDFSMFMLKNNHCNNRICGSATKLPFRNNSFDITFCSNLLHHLDEHEKCILEMKRVRYMEKLVHGAALKVLYATSTGTILPNKTPILLLPLLKKIDGEFPCAFYNVIISEKI